MATPALRRFLLVVTALAFVLATALPGSARAMPMPDGMAMGGSPAQPCDDCPGKAPAGDPGAKMMVCGALACAGIVTAAPVPLVLEAPFYAGFEYPAQASASQAGVALPPDPFPPRPIRLV
ncbi:hypothetical protein [Limobrevibacterium gyesilva]|uniref:Uncharacterized protein n=1 Tax=Limobrevibacterium gyesilva TaxID=2991712 RepID=A0AA41YYE7_9PROT|nr:hypothetical protein [Limobrevibacterium gyesilva]MCW3477537.1 hypothetical protein [Limobrevibacterium gyesilva]